MIIDERLSHIPNVTHGFFGRKGGVSGGIYESLNIRADENDSKENALRNRDIILEKIGMKNAKLATVKQIHSNIVVMVESETFESIEADGLVTNKRGIVLGISTADCAPVLFADKKNSVIGACHSGWRGTKAGIAVKTIEEMEKLGADRGEIVAAIGPCIGPNSYEVDEKFFDGFIADRPHNSDYFKAGRPGHYYFNLPGYILDSVKEAGVSDVNWTGQDTLFMTGDFFSYRRNTLSGIKNYGCQLSVIALR